MDIFNSFFDELEKIAYRPGVPTVGSTGFYGRGQGTQGGEMRGYRKGGIAGKKGPEVALLGEEGEEAVVPLKRKARFSAKDKKRIRASLKKRGS